MTSEEVRELLQELLLSIRAYREALREETNTSELESIRKKSENARKTLKSISKNHTRFTEESLMEEGPQAESSILEHLTSLAEEVKRERPGGLANQTWSTSAETVDDLNDKLEPFIRDNDENNASPIWPFVRIIRFVNTSFANIIVSLYIGYISALIF